MTNFIPVTIDLDIICGCLSKDAGRTVSDVEATVWLRGEGFVQFGDGWIGDQQSQRTLTDLRRKFLSQPAH